MNESYIRNVIEAALLAAGKSLQAVEIVELFDENARPHVEEVRAALAALVDEYAGRGIEVKETAAGFRIQVRRELATEISRLWPERPARYSRALLETLALIAYRQPITRGEIEAVRGVAVNPNILKTVIERNWVRVVGHRDVPGRPELLGTTREFLEYFGLKTLDELPPLAEIKALGEIKLQFDLPDAGPILASVGVVGELGVDAAGDGNGDVGANRDDFASATRDESATKIHDEASLPNEPTHAVERGPEVSKAARPRAVKSKHAGPDTALHEAEEFAASIDADLAAGDDDGTDDDELSAAGPGSSELVAGPRDFED